MAADSAPSASDRPDAFVSYSRHDKAFVESCIAPALEARGKDLWIDVDDIRGGAADWRATVWAGIEASRVVVVVLSPDSLASRVCGEELTQAVALNKRIIPVLRRAVDDEAVPEALARPNWILAREEDDLDKAIAALVTAVETDEAWLSLHARLTQRTGEWLRADRDRSYLLRGSDLRAAEAWLAEQSEHAQSPTAEQAAYIAAGRSIAARRQRLLLGGVLVALGISIGLGLYANHERRGAESQSRAAQAIDAARRDPERALRLALDAADLSRSALVRRALREAVAASRWTRLLRVQDDPPPVSQAEFSPDRGARLAVTSGAGPAAAVWDVRGGRRLASLEHAGDIHSARFSPDGRRILTASADGTARIWDRRGRRLAVLDPAGRDVWSAEFSRDGRLVITATDRGAAQVWDLSRPGSQVLLPGAAADHLAAASLSPDDRHALTAGAGDTLRVWTLSPRPRALVLRPLDRGQHQATVAIFSPDGRHVLAGYDTGVVCVWTPARSPRARACHDAQHNTITDIAVDRSGTRLVSASSDGTAVLRRMSGGPLQAVLRHRGPVNGVAFDGAQGRIVTASEDRTARLWSSAGKLERELTGHADAVVVAQFSRDGMRLLTGSDDGSARVWRIGPPTRALPDRPMPGADAAFSPDGRRVLAVDAAGHAALWDRTRGTREPIGPMLPTGDEVNSPCGRFTGCSPWAPDGASVAGIDAGERATIWDARTATPRPLGVGGAFSAAFGSGGSLVAVVRSERPAALVVRRSGGRPVSEVRTQSMEFRSARLAADDRKLLTVTVEGAVRVFDARRGTPAGPKATAAVARAAAITRDGTRVAVGTPDRRLEVHSGGRVRRSRPLTRAITALAFDRSGNRILTVGDDHAIRTWDAASLDTSPAVMRGHTDRLLSAEFSPDGRFVLSASRDGTARVWDPDLETPILVVPIGTHGGGARFSPDGRFIAVAGRRTLELHECVVCAPLDALRQVARSLLPQR